MDSTMLRLELMPGVLGSVAAQAAGLQLIAEGRLLQDDPDEDGKNNRDDDGNIDPARVAEQCANGPLGRIAPGFATFSAAVRSELDAPQPEASILAYWPAAD